MDPIDKYFEYLNPRKLSVKLLLFHTKCFLHTKCILLQFKCKKQYLPITDSFMSA